MTKRMMAAAVGLFILLVVAGVFAVANWTRSMDQRMIQLTQTVEQSARDARAAADHAARSSAAAEAAGTEARAAQNARAEALQKKGEAEAVAAEAAREAEAARAEAEKIRKEREQELARLKEALDHVVETRRTAFGLVMNLPESALRFDFNSARIRPEAREVLSRIAGILMTSDNYGLAVHGHTDDVGSPEYNQRLSERRAEAVREYMVAAGINPDIITIRGYGKASPLATGDDDAARAKNRRVEIALTDSKIRYTGEAKSESKVAP